MNRLLSIFKPVQINLVVGAFLLVLSGVLLADDVFETLRKMSESIRNRNYEATVIVRDGNDLRSFMLQHKAADEHSAEQEKLTALDGDYQEMVMDGDGMVLYTNQKHKFWMLRNPFIDTFGNLSNIPNFYQIEPFGEKRTFGRQTKVLNIKAPDQWRYSYKIWLDSKTKMYLRAKWYDHKKVIYESVLTNLKFKKRMSPLKKINKTSNKVTNTIRSQVVQDGRCHVKWLPDGFNLLYRSVYPNQSASKVEHLIFSDGLANISVYLNSAKDLPQKKIGMGRTNVYSKVIDAGNKIVVLGEVPFATVRKIADSVTVHSP